MLSKRLAASAAACLAIDVKGSAVVELQKDAVMLGQNGKFTFETGLLMPMLENFVTTCHHNDPQCGGKSTLMGFLPLSSYQHLCL